MGLGWTAANFVLLAAGALLASTYAFRQPRGSARILGAIVIGWTWLTVGMECLGASGYLTREALLAWSAAAFALGLGCRAFGRPPESHESRSQTRGLLALGRGDRPRFSRLGVVGPGHDARFSTGSRWSATVRSIISISRPAGGSRIGWT